MGEETVLATSAVFLRSEAGVALRYEDLAVRSETGAGWRGVRIGSDHILDQLLDGKHCVFGQHWKTRSCKEHLFNFL